MLKGYTVRRPQQNPRLGGEPNGSSDILAARDGRYWQDQHRFDRRDCAEH